MGIIETLQQAAHALNPGTQNANTEVQPVEREVVDKERGLVSPALPVAQTRAPTTTTSPNDYLIDSVALAKKMVGGRISADTENSFFGSFRVVLPPNSPESDWRTAMFDEETLSKISTSELIKLLIDLSPDVSKATFDFLRFCNPGYEFKVYRGDDPNSIYKRGQDAVKAFIDQLSDYYGSFDQLIGRMFMAAWLRGAFFAELVLNPSATRPIDLVVPDPSSVRFVLAEDPERGPVHMLAQVQYNKGIQILNRPTIRYIAVDPFPGSPYGRPLISPALFATLFLLGLLHDLRRVIAQQGYPRLDLVLNLEAIQASMPPDIENDPKKQKIFIDAMIDAIKDYYKQLKPDDAFVHADTIEVKAPVGALGARSFGGLDGLINFIERMAIRALKTMPLLMGVSDALSEANATRQWEIHVAGIKSLQHYCETMLEKMFTLALQAQGIPAHVQFRFAELRAAEELRDAQTMTLKIGNWEQCYLNGWADQDEASQAVLGHKASEPEPRAVASTEVFKGWQMQAAKSGDPNAEPAPTQPDANPKDPAKTGASKKPKDSTKPKNGEGAATKTEAKSIHTHYELRR